MGKKLGVRDSDLSPWYKVSIKELQEYGGPGLLARYRNVISRMLETVYPEYDWLPWKFTVSPHNSWKDPAVILKAVKFAEKSLNLKEVQDWHRVSISQLREIDLAQIFLNNGGVANVLKIAYPDYSPPTAADGPK